MIGVMYKIMSNLFKFKLFINFYLNKLIGNASVAGAGIVPASKDQMKVAAIAPITFVLTETAKDKIIQQMHTKGII